jgi:hypothetical protein
LRVLVVDAPHDGMLERTAKGIAEKRHFRALAQSRRKIDRSLFLMDLVLPERYGATADFQYRRWIQAGQHRLVAKKEGNAIEYRQGGHA